MSGSFLKWVAVAAWFIAADFQQVDAQRAQPANAKRPNAQISGGVSRRVIPPPNRPDRDFRNRGQDFRMNLRDFLRDNPQARHLFGPRFVVTPPALASVSSSMYGGGYGDYGGYNREMYQQEPVPMPQSDKNPDLEKAVAATGVFNKDGKVVWPLGLKILPGAEADRLRTQLTAMFQVLATQMVQGTVNPLLPGEINEAVDRLATLLRLDRETRRSLVSENLYDGSSRFLNKMREATRIAAAVQPAGQSNPYLSSETAGGVYGAGAYGSAGAVYGSAQPAQTGGKNPY